MFVNQRWFVFISICWILFSCCMLFYCFLHGCCKLAATEDQLVLEQQRIVLCRWDHAHACFPHRVLIHSLSHLASCIGILDRLGNVDVWLLDRTCYLACFTFALSEFLRLTLIVHLVWLIIWMDQTFATTLWLSHCGCLIVWHCRHALVCHFPKIASMHET